MDVPYSVKYEKPVGHYWMCLPTGALFGLAGDPLETSPEWALRLPSAISAMLALIAAAIMAFRIYGARTCALSVVVLGSMMYFVHLARLAHIDMPLAAAYTCCMMFFYLGYLEKMKSNFLIYGFYAFLGWGLVLKGPVVIILAGLAIFALMCLLKRWKMPLEIRPFSGALVMLAVCLPWYIAEHIRSKGEFYEEFILNQNIRRFTGINSVYHEGKRMSYFYYFPKLLANALPWSIIAVLGIAVYWKRLIKMRFSTPTLFLMMWFLTGFVFFSLSALKRGDYLLPLYPALAILIAASINRFIENPPPFPKWWGIVWGVFCALNLIVVTFILSGYPAKMMESVISDTAKKSIISRNDAMNIYNTCIFVKSNIIIVMIALVVVAAILFALGKLLEKRRNGIVLAIASCVIMVFYVVFYGILEPATDELRTVKPFVSQVRMMLPDEHIMTYFENFNTEMIFFMARPYEVKITDDTNYVITSPRGMKKLEKSGELADWNVILSTQENHYYPAILLRRASLPLPPSPDEVETAAQENVN